MTLPAHQYRTLTLSLLYIIILKHVVRTVVECDVNYLIKQLTQREKETEGTHPGTAATPHDSTVSIRRNHHVEDASIRVS